MQNYAESNGYSVVRDFVGHGIGRTMHEDPKVPNFVNRDLLKNDIKLREGVVLVRCEAQPFDGFHVVLRDTLSGAVHDTEAGLREGLTLLGSLP